jgi:hypothetical protein
MSGLIDPANGGFTVTPSDTTVFTDYTTALWVGTTGDVKVEMINGDIVTITSIPNGTLLPIQVKRVYSTDTDASDIVGFY